jgi:hypothetical protein
MANAGQVLSMLCPNVEWTIIGDDFDSIIWNDGVAPITKKQFTDGFAQFDAWQAKQEADKSAARQAILDRLGITEDEAALILG